ncbi:MAG: hypothetical protein M1834_002008 [Cirrosporium novae-zelandiae]|nr:MAG: hypothetical protein M1834_002008 [Cirrosporium novae-zelandiae]
MSVLNNRTDIWLFQLPVLDMSFIDFVKAIAVTLGLVILYNYWLIFAILIYIPCLFLRELVWPSKPPPRCQPPYIYPPPGETPWLDAGIMWTPEHPEIPGEHQNSTPQNPENS